MANLSPITLIKLLFSFYRDEKFPVPLDQKECRKRSRGTKDQLSIDKAILDDFRKRHTNYRKAYNMVPHSWRLKILELEQVSDNIVNFLKASMTNWQTELTSCGDCLAKVNTRRDFPG